MWVFCFSVCSSTLCQSLPPSAFTASAIWPFTRVNDLIHQGPKIPLLVTLSALAVTLIVWRP